MDDSRNLERLELPHNDPVIELMGGVIVPNDKMHVENAGDHLAMSDGDVERFRTRNGNLFLYGFVEYRDIHQRSHRTHFAFRHDPDYAPPRFVIVTNENFWQYT